MSGIIASSSHFAPFGWHGVDVVCVCGGRLLDTLDTECSFQLPMFVFVVYTKVLGER